MKLIKPSEISATILTLLDESDERVILVSPYMKISKWYKLMNKINGLKSRGILTEIFVRDDPENTATYHELDQLALEYNKIPNLHSKFYLNERYGIVTSMNLLLSSEINSLEIGYVTENRKEYNNLLDYYFRYVQTGEPVHYSTIASRSCMDLKEIKHRIREELKRNAKNSWFWLEDNTLHISTGRNNYSISINEGSLRITAELRISASISSGLKNEAETKQKRKQHSSLIATKIIDLTAMEVDVYVGRVNTNSIESEHVPDILQISGRAKHTLKSTCITWVLKDEAAFLIESVRKFIDATDDLERIKTQNPR